MIKRIIIILPLLVLGFNLSSCKEESLFTTNLILNDYTALTGFKGIVKLYDLSLKDNLFIFKLNFIIDYYELNSVSDSIFNIEEVNVKFNDINSSEFNYIVKENLYTERDININVKFDESISVYNSLELSIKGEVFDYLIYKEHK